LASEDLKMQMKYFAASSNSFYY